MAMANHTRSNANSYAQQVADFNRFTRNRNYKLPAFTRATNNLLARFDLPPSYLIGRVKMDIRGQISTVAGSVHAGGQTAIVKSVRVQTNMADDLHSFTGKQYFAGLAPVIDLPGNVIPQSTALNVLAANGLVVLPITIPFSANLRDVAGLVPAQNRQTVITVWVEFETDANLGVTGWTTQPVVNFTVEAFEIPFEITAQPPIALLHRINGLPQTVPGAQDFYHSWDQGMIVAQKIHVIGWNAATPADAWSKVRLVRQQSDNLYVYDKGATVDDQTQYLAFIRPGVTRNLGVIYFDLMGQSGLGPYGIPRDALNMYNETDVNSIISATGAATIDTITRYFQRI